MYLKFGFILALAYKYTLMKFQLDSYWLLLDTKVTK